MKTIINHYETRGRVFTVVHDQDHYLAIEDKYIDDAGRVTQQLNGFQMHAAKELQECLDRTASACWMDELIEQGATKAEAFCKVNGMECTDLIRQMFGEAV